MEWKYINSLNKDERKTHVDTPIQPSQKEFPLNPRSRQKQNI